MKSMSIFPSPSREVTEAKDDCFPDASCSSMCVSISHMPAMSVNAAKMGKMYFQLPSVLAAKAAMKGPQKEDTALTTWPAVSELVSASPLTTLVSRGLSDTWRMVFPMPRNTNPIMQVAKL